MRAVNFSVPVPWPQIFKRAAIEIYSGNCFAWAATLAYCFFFALFPALLFVVSLASVLPVQPLVDRMIAALRHVAPDDVVTIARQQLTQITSTPSVGLLALSLVGAIWSVSSGMAALVDTLNQAYRVVERRPWWRIRLTAIALTLALTLVVMIAFGLVVAMPAAAGWPMAAALLVAALGATYYFAPDVSREWVWISPGTITATAIWLLISLGFKWYVIHFGEYQKTYGAIGGVLVTLLWFYFSSLAILLGAQLDATIAHASPSEPDATLPLRGIKDSPT